MYVEPFQEGPLPLVISSHKSKVYLKSQSGDQEVYLENIIFNQSAENSWITSTTYELKIEGAGRFHISRQQDMPSSIASFLTRPQDEAHIELVVQLKPAGSNHFVEVHTRLNLVDRRTDGCTLSLIHI